MKARLALAIVAALNALPVQVSGAAAPADDEYVLKLPGVTQSESAVNEDSGTNGTSARHEHGGGLDAAGSGIQRGAVGEADAPPTPLAAAGDALTAVPASLLIGAGLLLAMALIAWARRHRRPSAC
jgi:hypothetical protein